MSNVLLSPSESILDCKGDACSALPAPKIISISPESANKTVNPIRNITFSNSHPLAVLILMHYLYTDQLICIGDRRVSTGAASQTSSSSSSVTVMPALGAQIKSELQILAKTLVLPEVFKAMESVTKRPVKETLCKDLTAVWNSNNLASTHSSFTPDVALQLAEGRKVRAYSTILRAWSVYFDDFLSEEEWTKLRRGHEKVLKVNLQHMRFGVMEDPSNYLLLSEASHYHAYELVSSVEAYISENLETFLESHMLEDLSPSLVKHFSAFIRTRQEDKAMVIQSNMLHEKATRKEIIAGFQIFIVSSIALTALEHFVWPSKRARKECTRSPIIGPRFSTSPGLKPQAPIPESEDIFDMDEMDIGPPSIDPAEPCLSSGGSSGPSPAWKASFIPRVDMRSVMAEAAIASEKSTQIYTTPQARGSPSDGMLFSSVRLRRAGSSQTQLSLAFDLPSTPPSPSPVPRPSGSPWKTSSAAATATSAFPVLGSSPAPASKPRESPASSNARPQLQASNSSLATVPTLGPTNVPRRVELELKQTRLLHKLWQTAQRTFSQSGLEETRGVEVFLGSVVRRDFRIGEGRLQGEWVRMCQGVVVYPSRKELLRQLEYGGGGEGVGDETSPGWSTFDMQMWVIVARRWVEEGVAGDSLVTFLKFLFPERLMTDEEIEHWGMLFRVALATARVHHGANEAAMGLWQALVADGAELLLFVFHLLSLHSLS
ncbi:hypothetical protein BT96DRAFT_999186 [Gymnopus androsaceus JB14]|uniref:BTB domain-containing protein n=1 Tax=Gymnopus androsaceus JB14 TaxID=1447944 RepID=A0A6A4H7H2_9AGAR|nr:hypothetical protein BT96DRAFT_999186 [Gymnopus androsaceus JB14]